LRPVETAIFALVCSYLRARFVYAGTFAEQALHYVFAALSYFLSGLFVTTLVRNQELVSQHLQKLQVEQALRREAEEHLQLLAASSPAAILTTEQGGLVLSANQAAENLFHIPAGQTLRTPGKAGLVIRIARVNNLGCARNPGRTHRHPTVDRVRNVLARRRFRAPLLAVPARTAAWSLPHTSPRALCRP